MGSSGPRRHLGSLGLLEVLIAVLAVALAALSAASTAAANDDAEWDAVSEYPGAERQGAILQALSLGLNFTNVSRNDCVWRKLQESHDACPGEDVTVHLYTSTNESRLVNVSEANSLLEGDWDPQKHTIVLVHGYGGAHDTLPLTILRDAYLLAGGYNVLVVDWSPLARLPCYPAAVHNSVVAARCVGGVARLLRDSGARGDAWTCVGHSLGAHVHLSSICFLADSIDGQSPLVAEPCGRRCPSARRQQSEHKQRLGLPSSLGQHTPDSASGTFCATSDAEPYCQREPGGRGHPRCCPPRHQAATTTTTAAPSTAAATTTDGADAAKDEAAATAAQVTAGPSTASTVGSTLGTEAATETPAPTTESSFKVGAALPALPTTTTTTTTTTAASHGFSPVTFPMRADRVTLPDQMSSQVGDQIPETTQQVFSPTTVRPLSFPTQPPASPADQDPTVDDIPVVMMPPPMPLPDWTPVMFVDDKGLPEAARPQEPLLVPQRPSAPASPLPAMPWDLPGDAQGASLPGWTSPQPITPQRWTPPPIRVPSEPVAVPAAPATPPPPPAVPIRWPTAIPPGVHIVMPSNDTSLYEEAVTEEGPVIAIYSTKSPLGPPPPKRPLVVVTANSGAHPQQHQPPPPQQQQQLQPHAPQQQPHPQHHHHQQQQQNDIRDNLIEPSTAFAEVTLSPAGVSNTINMDEEMAAMTEMSPPRPEPILVGFPSPSPPSPEPAVPEEPGMIPAAGSPTGAWLPMVMLPPTPFSVDSWALRYKDRLPRPTAVRRTSYRKRVYD
ncbi:hypothetical protein FOCC_FOCC000592 [Frankliniella occidentalis]|nr:hypothetical protein FOCC_FOCC000592 [Frankliniella occidentalis]